jgi:hypothetical protein
MCKRVESVREKIIDEIRQAFGHVSREDGVTLHEAKVIDDYGSDEERVAARLLDTDRSWQDVPDHLVEESQETLCFVDPPGFCYYLPAYMTWALRNYETSESFSVDHATYSLTISEDTPQRAWHLERFGLFDVEQRKAICRFLRFMAEQQDFADAVQARKALEGYWGKFCENAK